MSAEEKPAKLLFKELLPGDIYRHFKGGRYRLIAVARHSETGEQLAVYFNERNLAVYARPVDGPNGFCGVVEDRELPDGTVYSGPRFLRTT